MSTLFRHALVNMRHSSSSSSARSVSAGSVSADYLTQLQTLWGKNNQKYGTALQEYVAKKELNYTEKNQHINRGARGEAGPNAEGVYLTARLKYNRGCYGSWGTLVRSISRMRYRRKY